MPNKYEVYHKYKYFPLKVSIAYILITFIISVIGPVEYFDGAYKYWLVVPFIAAVIFCLYIGYFLGIHSKSKAPVPFYQDTIDHRENKLFIFSIYISIASLLVEFAYLLSIGHFSLNISALGALYVSQIEESASFVKIFRFLSSACRMISLSYGMVLYKKASADKKILIIINTVLYVLVFLFGYGNQKGVSDIIIYFAVAVFLSRIRDGKKTRKKGIAIIVVAGIASFFFFSFIQSLRYAPLGINASNYHLYSSGEFYFNTDHFVFKLFGDDLGFGMATILNGYLSQGYYGLSLCLQLPFTWSYGIGSSYALTKIVEKIGVTGIYEKTYLAQMTSYYGRNGLRAWNTIFPWLASDFTWIGAILFFAVVGYFMAKSWQESILYENMISYLMLICIVIMIAFVPANNQLFHGYDSFIATWTIILNWLFGRRRYSRE